MDDFTEEPLDSYRKYFNDVSTSDLQIKSLGYKSQVNLRLSEADVPILESEIGVTFPKEINFFISNSEYNILCLGPDEWLIICYLDKREQLIKNINEIKFNKFVSISDVSFNRVIIDIVGIKSNELINSLSNIQKQYFDLGRCTQSIMSNTQVILMCMESNFNFNILVRSSFARFLSDVIIDQIRLV